MSLLRLRIAVFIPEMEGRGWIDEGRREGEKEWCKEGETEQECRQK